MLFLVFRLFAKTSTSKCKQKTVDWLARYSVVVCLVNVLVVSCILCLLFF